MNIKGKPAATSLVRKCEWCYILHLSFTVDGLNEWIADICLGLQVFFTAGQFSTDRILRERQRQDACSKLKNEFLCPNIILWLGHHVCWSRTSKIVHPEVRFVKSFTPKRDFWKIISQTRDLRCPPRVQLLLLHVYGQEYGWYHTEQDWQYLFGILIIILIVVIVVISFVSGYQLNNVSR